MDADRYLCMVERLVNEHPEIAVSESGIVQRIMVFRKNGLPKPKRDEDSEQEYRKYKNQIETTLNRYMRSKEYDTSSLQQVVELIEKMTCMPEHEFFKNTYAMAKYYYVLNMLFGNVGRKDLAYQMLQKATQIADNDDDKRTAAEKIKEMYGSNSKLADDFAKPYSIVEKWLKEHPSND